MPFTDTADATHYLASVFQAGFDDPEISPALAKSGLVLRMDVTEPELVMTVDLVNQTIHTGDSDGAAPEANMTLGLTADTANRFWQGKVSVPLAVARGQIKLGGALPKLIALLPSAKPIQQRYVATLAADGRADLIA
ncbi:sterol carrier protein [Nocardioides aromaticivorans]|uniref:Sterol carrier protein n=1 Tax=Nocardioides aromaticivorans TaxID=200618 RepID=A0ABX7PEN9_9ACTN|nr:SCP2 sterol-binding domain-containing protein [Nocardioides aromaticivorans]QSR24298.1 sterol carrier protein [Nocardioides aromaticivorans]